MSHMKWDIIRNEGNGSYFTYVGGESITKSETFMGTVVTGAVNDW
jgi:hypothetical protein